MQTIRTTDTLFATVISHGTTLVSTRISGMTTIGEILDYIRRQAGHIAGLITLRLRNMTSGWSIDRSILLRPAQQTAAVPDPVPSDGYPSLFAAQGL